MFSPSNFSHVFSSAPFPYDRKFVQETETFRKSFDGALFIDRVLKALGITKGMVASLRGFTGPFTDLTRC